VYVISFKREQYKQNISDMDKRLWNYCIKNTLPKSGFIRAGDKKISLIGRETSEVSLTIHESIFFLTSKNLNLK